MPHASDDLIEVQKLLVAMHRAERAGASPETLESLEQDLCAYDGVLSQDEFTIFNGLCLYLHSLLAGDCRQSYFDPDEDYYDGFKTGNVISVLDAYRRLTNSSVADRAYHQSRIYEAIGLTDAAFEFCQFWIQNIKSGGSHAKQE